MLLAADIRIIRSPPFLSACEGNMLKFFQYSGGSIAWWLTVDRVNLLKNNCFRSITKNNTTRSELAIHLKIGIEFLLSLDMERIPPSGLPGTTGKPPTFGVKNPT
jgi:hypothetical protein